LFRLNSIKRRAEFLDFLSLSFAFHSDGTKKKKRERSHFITRNGDENSLGQQFLEIH